MMFLVGKGRSGIITKAEINWYQQYQKLWQKDQQLYGNKDTNTVCLQIFFRVIPLLIFRKYGTVLEQCLWNALRKEQRIWTRP